MTHSVLFHGRCCKYFRLYKIPQILWTSLQKRPYIDHIRLQTSNGEHIGLQHFELWFLKPERTLMWARDIFAYITYNLYDIICFFKKRLSCFCVAFYGSYECYIQLIQSSSSRGLTKINDDVSTTKLAPNLGSCNATCLLCSITQVEYDLNTLITSSALTWPQRDPST